MLSWGTIILYRNYSGIFKKRRSDLAIYRQQQSSFVFGVGSIIFKEDKKKICSLHIQTQKTEDLKPLDATLHFKSKHTKHLNLFH